MQYRFCFSAIQLQIFLRWKALSLTSYHIPQPFYSPVFFDVFQVIPENMAQKQPKIVVAGMAMG
jgi:hypothetical protein